MLFPSFTPKSVEKFTTKVYSSGKYIKVHKTYIFYTNAATLRVADLENIVESGSKVPTVFLPVTLHNFKISYKLCVSKIIA